MCKFQLFFHLTHHRHKRCSPLVLLGPKLICLTLIAFLCPALFVGILPNANHYSDFFLLWALSKRGKIKYVCSGLLLIHKNHKESFPSYTLACSCNLASPRTNLHGNGRLSSHCTEFLYLYFFVFLYPDEKRLIMS